MPAHWSHLLQPLDVGCFSALKQAYGYNVEQIMRSRVNHFDKREFLPLYRQARQTALHANNIRAGFSATGLIPYCPERVLSQLHVQYQTPSPQHCPPSNASWVTETLHNLIELQKQTALLQRHIQQSIHSPLSLTRQALSQLVKGCEMAMSSAVLLASENEQLRIENQRQKRKRAKKHSFIARGGVLSGAEGTSLTQASQISTAEGGAEAAAERLQRAPRHCSICCSIEHTVRKCPTRQAIS